MNQQNTFCLLVLGALIWFLALVQSARGAVLSTWTHDEATATVAFQVDYRDQLGQIVVEGFADDLSEVFTVTLFFLHPPRGSAMELKAGQNRKSETVSVPDCDVEPIQLGIPEPRTALFFALGGLFLLCRRRRTSKPKTQKP